MFDYFDYLFQITLRVGIALFGGLFQGGLRLLILTRLGVGHAQRVHRSGVKLLAFQQGYRSAGVLRGQAGRGGVTQGYRVVRIRPGGDFHCFAVFLRVLRIAAGHLVHLVLAQ